MSALIGKLDRTDLLGRQISERIRSAIHEKRLHPGERLPSLRRMAQDLNVSIDTVQDAYRLLGDEGLVQARRGAGFYVCEQQCIGHLTNETPLIQTQNISHHNRQPSAKILEKTRGITQCIANDYSTNVRTPLATYASGMECIAEKHFLRFAAQLARSPWLHNSYSDPQGYLPLRHAICRKLRQFQGLIVHPEQIVITNGLIQSINLLSEILFEPEDPIWIENPGYSTVEDTLRFRNLNPISVPVDLKGFDTAKALAVNPNAKGVFLSSASQYPLSIAMEENRAQALLEWARQTRGWIIEDGTDGIISLSGKPFCSLLKQNEMHDGVIYIESFSLQIAPGFRMGYIVVPETFAKVCTAAKFLTDRNTGESSQALLAEFLDSDVYDSYIRRLNRRYRQRYAVLQMAVEEKLSSYGELLPAQYGCRVVFSITAPISDLELCSELSKAGIHLRALSACCRGEAFVNGVILGFGTSSESEIWKAVGCIGHCCAKLLQK